MIHSSETHSPGTHSPETHSPESTLPARGIREFARYYGYSEAEVRRAMRQLSIRGTSQGRGRPTLLSPAEQGALLEYIEGPDEQVATQSVLSAPVPPVQNLPIQDIPDFDQSSGVLAPAEDSFPPHDLEISAGNHRTTLDAPPLPQSYDLAQFRGPESIQAIADPGEVANQAMAAIDALVSGMDADIRQQRQQLEQTQEAAQALRIKAKQLQDKKLEYMIQSTAMGQSQQRYTAELQEALGEIQSLGKSPRSEQEPPSS